MSESEELEIAVVLEVGYAWAQVMPAWPAAGRERPAIAPGHGLPPLVVWPQHAVTVISDLLGTACSNATLDAVLREQEAQAMATERQDANRPESVRGRCRRGERLGSS